MWLYGIIFIWTSAIYSVHTIPIQVSKPKAVISDIEYKTDPPFVLVKTTESNGPILIKIPAKIRLPDPEKDQYLGPYQPQYDVEPTATPQYYISSIKPSKNDGYDYYFPQLQDATNAKDPHEAYLIELQPPIQYQSEPNYYAKVKKTTTKKYNPIKKHINYRDYKSNAETIDATEANPDDTLHTEASENINVQAIDRQLLVPQVTIKPMLNDADLNVGEYLPGPLRRADENDRIEYQMHGFNGPNSYKFGYDTGKGKNRQYRVEQRDKDGNVTGQYGYLDQNGKMNIVKYKSSANGGFTSELSS